MNKRTNMSGIGKRIATPIPSSSSMATVRTEHPHGLLCRGGDVDWAATDDDTISRPDQMRGRRSRGAVGQSCSSIRRSEATTVNHRILLPIIFTCLIGNTGNIQRGWCAYNCPELSVCRRLV